MLPTSTNHYSVKTRAQPYIRYYFTFVELLFLLYRVPNSLESCKMVSIGPTIKQSKENDSTQKARHDGLISYF